MDENKSSVKPTVIKSITALLCCAALAFTGNSITGKVCDNKKAIADATGGKPAASASAAADNTVTGTDFADGTFADDASLADAAIDDASSADDTATYDLSSDDTATTTDPGSTTGSNSGSKTPDKKPAAKEITLTSGLNSNDKAEVLKYYRLIAKKNATYKDGFNTKMVMTKLDGGKGGVGALISAFEPIAKKALEKNSTTSSNFPGDPDKILESDWESASAKNDGTYTTINIKLKAQTDGANGKSKVGTVGRTVDVLDGVQTALDELNGVSADFENGKFSLVYDQAYATIKVKTATGELVKGGCTWHYRVNVNLDNITVKVAFVSATLNGGKGIIDYTYSY